jgi:hypothetical protein
MFNLKDDKSLTARQKIVARIQAIKEILIKGGCIKDYHKIMNPTELFTPVSTEAITLENMTELNTKLTEEYKNVEIMKPTLQLASITSFQKLPHPAHENRSFIVSLTRLTNIYNVGDEFYPSWLPYFVPKPTMAQFGSPANFCYYKSGSKIKEAEEIVKNANLCKSKKSKSSCDNFRIAPCQKFLTAIIPTPITLEGGGVGLAPSTEAIDPDDRAAANSPVSYAQGLCKLLTETLPNGIELPDDFGFTSKVSAVELPDTKWFMVEKPDGQGFWASMIKLDALVAANVAAGSDDESTPGKTGSNSSFGINKFFVGLVGFLIAKAKASTMDEDTSDGWGIAMFTAFGIGIIIGLIVMLSGKTDRYVARPGTRAILFGVMATLALTSAIITHVSVGNLEDAELALQAILKSTDAVAVSEVGMDSAGAGGSSVVDFNFDDSKKDETIDLGNNGQPLMCQCGGDGKNGCKKCGKAIKVELAKVGFGTGTNSASSLIGKTSDALSDGQLTSEELQTIASLGKNFAFIKKRAGKLKNFANKRLQKLGIKTFDSDKEEKIFAASIRSATQKAIASNPNGANDLLSLSGDEKKGKEENKKKAAQIMKKIASVPKTGSTKSNDPFSGMNFQMEDDSMDDDSLFDDEPDNSPTISDDMYIPDNDIFSNPDASIFKMITTRYFKTAYPRFFDEDKLIDSGKK